MSIVRHLKLQPWFINQFLPLSCCPRHNELSVTNIKIHKRNTHSVTDTNPEIYNESPFGNEGGWLKKKLYSTFGYGRANRFALATSTIFIYEACTDKLDIEKFIKNFNLDDTFFSFFLVTQLHVWMCQTRSMLDGKEGRIVRNEILERMWQDIDTRIKKLEVMTIKQRKKVLNDLLFHHQCAMLSYDEGLLTDDKTLANAVWRTLYSKDPDADPRKIELVVKYIRDQMAHLKSLGPDEWCLDGHINWKQFKNLIE